MSIGITIQEVEAQRNALNEIRKILGKPEEPSYQTQNKSSQPVFASPFSRVIGSKTPRHYHPGPQPSQEDFGQ